MKGGQTDGTLDTTMCLIYKQHLSRVVISSSRIYVKILQQTRVHRGNHDNKEKARSAYHKYTEVKGRPICDTLPPMRNPSQPARR